ncbi:helix-turn-helix transcriptional regulator [Acidisoma cellulosilytica]|uniref:Helix-turn-helix transcriptional regulator n=1 Tax=Acidisoma cellulosilyticum TaxID=2802395 RepID=A0A963Z043_9PROT|nr:helix-turn-helix transcriptional regulator [Acidisoma cellulosilyticum]MCB8880106.1 helix-turn-helix transcriptional regulator [Acidisoma cellulosilyticum]
MDGPTLRAWREARGLSRRAASDVLGVNEQTLVDLESGRRSGAVLMPVLERLTAALQRLGE